MESIRFPRLTFDRQALELVTLFVVVLGATAAIASQIPTETASSVGPPDSFGDGAQGEATAGAAFAIFEVAYAFVVLGVILAFKKLPEWLQTTLKRNGVIVLLVAWGFAYSPSQSFVAAVGIPLGIYTTYRVFDHFGLYWILNNLLSVALAVVGGLAVGLTFGVAGIGVLLVGLTVYDHVFANKKSWMMSMADGIMSLRVPALFFRPNRLRAQWDEITDMEEEADDDTPNEEKTSWGLGTADMLLPAGFVAAVVLTPTDALLVGGVLAGVVCIAGALVACCRLRWEMLSHGSGAGLPALSAGVLVPYVAIAVVATLV